MRWVNDTHGPELKGRLVFEAGWAQGLFSWCSDSNHDAAAEAAVDIASELQGTRNMAPRITRSLTLYDFKIWYCTVVVHDKERTSVGPTNQGTTWLSGAC